jgi:hypothetical protein
MFKIKIVKPPGKWRAFEKTYYHILYLKKEVGEVYISEKDGKFVIHLSVLKKDINEDGNPNCAWRWIWLNKRSDTLEEVTDFLNSAKEEILRRYNLHEL